MKPSDITTDPRLAGLVKRYHTWPTITTQSTAEHSWQVYRIYYELFGRPSEGTSYYIMFHDLGEIVTGDLPYPIKSENPQLKKTIDNLEAEAITLMGISSYVLVDPTEIFRVKLCHMLEMMEFGLQEHNMGNLYAGPIWERCLEAARKLIAQMPEASERDRASRFVDKRLA